MSDRHPSGDLKEQTLELQYSSHCQQPRASHPDRRVGKREVGLEQSSAQGGAKQALQLEEAQGNTFVLWLSQGTAESSWPFLLLVFVNIKKERERCIWFFSNSDQLLM